MARDPKASKDRRQTRFTDERWRMILDSTADIFAKRGYEGTGVRDVAEGVGLLSGSLYYYIDTKEDLLFAIISDFHRMGLAAIDEVLQSAGPDAVSKLRAVLARSGELNAENISKSAVFYNEFRHLSSERKHDIVKDRRIHETLVVNLIREAQADGSVDPSLDPDLTAVSMLSLLNATYTWYRPASPFSPQEIGDFQASLLLGGILTRHGHAAVNRNSEEECNDSA